MSTHETMALCLGLVGAAGYHRGDAMGIATSALMIAVAAFLLRV